MHLLLIIYFPCDILIPKDIFTEANIMDTPKYCTNCGAPLNGAKFCQNCGQAVEIKPETKFCKFCGEVIPGDAVVCTHCGRQVENLAGSTPTVVVNNVNNNNNENLIDGVYMKRCDKWIAFLLCFFLGGFGAHKFYEGRIGMGILYLLTGGLLCIGWFIDLIAILLKPNPYYV